MRQYLLRQCGAVARTGADHERQQARGAAELAAVEHELGRLRGTRRQRQHGLGQTRTRRMGINGGQGLVLQAARLHEPLARRHATAFNQARGLMGRAGKHHAVKSDAAIAGDDPA